jgi:hypothetical protein
MNEAPLARSALRAIDYSVNHALPAATIPPFHTHHAPPSAERGGDRWGHPPRSGHAARGLPRAPPECFNMSQ